MAQAEEVRITRPSGAPPESGWPLVVLIHEHGGSFASTQQNWLLPAGYAVIECRWDEAAEKGDPECLRSIERTVSEVVREADVDRERVAVVGFGPGAPIAFLFACRSTLVGAAAFVHGPLVYPRLDALHPIQPLEMALNLGCPVMGVYAEADDAVTEAHLDRLQAVLSQFAKPYDIVRLPGVGARFYEREHAEYDPAATEAAERDLESFLQTNLEIE